MEFFKTQGDRKICQLCSHYCKLKEGQSGICGVNKNVGDKVQCLVYGYPAALNVDPIEKKPLYHFLPGSKSLSFGTVGCNFKCPFCQNWDISQEHEIKKDDYYSADYIVTLAGHHGCKSISFTYNEPTIFYPFARDIALDAKKYDIKSVFVSNGFESKEVISDMKGIIDAVNIDLKSFNDVYYKKSLGGKLNIVLDNLVRFKEQGIHLEITTLIVPTKNDSTEELTSIVKFIKDNLGTDVPWHVSAFHPDYKEITLDRTPDESLKKAFDIAKEYGLNYVYMGNSNFDNHTFCKNCNKKLISRHYFNLVKNDIVDGKCPDCGTVVDGVFK